MDFLYTPSSWDDPTELLIIITLIPILLFICLWPLVKKTDFFYGMPFFAGVLISAALGFGVSMLVSGIGLLIDRGNSPSASTQLVAEVAETYGLELSDESAEGLLEQEGDDGETLSLRGLAEGRGAGVVERFGNVDLIFEGDQLNLQLVWLGDEWVLAEFSEGGSQVEPLETVN